LGTAKPSGSDLIAPCGMNCAICASYLALVNDVKNRGVKMPYCAGCRPRDKKCAFLKKRCSKLLNGEVAFCYECPSFPCESLRTLDDRYKSRYRMSMIDNLSYIKEHGMHSFLEEQAKKWKCPNCGEMICCHNGICFNCELEKLRNKKEKYRWHD
jgi:hypothetical protein